MAGLPYPLASLGLDASDVEPAHIARLDAIEAAARNCGVSEGRIQRESVAALQGAGPRPAEDPFGDHMEMVVAGYEDGLGLACRRRRALIYGGSILSISLVAWAGYQLIRRA
jgi:hypothetical protein